MHVLILLFFFVESKKSGHLASQEELDSVIDLLSGFPKYGGLPSPATGSGSHPNPEGLPPKHPAAPTATALSASSKAVGGHLGHGPLPPPPLVGPGCGPGAGGFPSHMFSHPPPQLPVDASYNSSLLGSRTHQHRRSDGLIGETLNRANQKTNTWPYRPQQRVPDAPASSAAATMSPYSHSHTGSYDGHVSDAEYSRYLAAVKQMKQNNSQGATGGTANALLAHNSMWSTGDTNFNRSWPVQMFQQEGYVLVNNNAVVF